MGGVDHRGSGQLLDESGPMLSKSRPASCRSPHHEMWRVARHCARSARYAILGRSTPPASAVALSRVGATQGQLARAVLENRPNVCPKLVSFGTPPEHGCSGPGALRTGVAFHSFGQGIRPHRHGAIRCGALWPSSALEVHYGSRQSGNPTEPLNREKLGWSRYGAARRMAAKSARCGRLLVCM